MLYLIGLGLNEEGITCEAWEALKKCRKVYLEGYTVDFPYSVAKLEKALERKVERLERGDVESARLVDEAKKADIALLVYGSPLFATTHIGLVIDARESGVECKVLFNASVFDAVGATGLQFYKFGKTASMAKWLPEKKYTPDSFVEVIKDNQKIKAHTLLLIDIGFKPEDALKQLEAICSKNKIKLEKILICSRLGAEGSKIYYSRIEGLKQKCKEIKMPFCIIIPSEELHFLEKEALEKL